LAVSALVVQLFRLLLSATIFYLALSFSNMSIIQISLTYKSSKSIIHLFIFKKLGILSYKVDSSE
jgi:hypothetical protein